MNVFIGRKEKCWVCKTDPNIFDLMRSGEVDVSDDPWFSSAASEMGLKGRLFSQEVECENCGHEWVELTAEANALH